MSAQVSFTQAEPTQVGPRLTLVPPVRSTVSTMGFALIVMVLVALGMGVVMVVTTSVAAQSRELSSLRTEATELEYTAAALTTELQSTSSSASLAMRASDLGMVPNRYPAFIRLSDGAILGDPTPVTRDESPYLRRVQQASAATPQVRSNTLKQSLPVAPDGDR